jgi:peptidoglycan/LPS O-acetylase OafA/YrhL
VIVLLYHLLLTAPAAWDVLEHGREPLGWSDPMAWVIGTPLSIAVFGSAAVLVFFVLSGFVLTLSFEKVDRYRYAPFLIKRVVRIWAPFAVSILISAAGAALLRSTDTPASDWLRDWSWTEPPDVRVLAHHLAMTGAEVSYNNPMWSLVHELRVSVVFPLIALAALRAPIATVAIAGALSVGAVVLMTDHQRWSVGSLLSTLSYVYLFAAGAALYRVLPALRARLSRIPRVGILAIWAVIAGGLWFCFWLDYVRTDKWDLFPIGVLSIAVVTMALRGDAVSRMLSGPVAKFLGRISYSLYLIHMPVMLIVLHLWGERPGLDVARFIAFGLCFPAAWLLNLAVERPAQDFGRWLAAQTSGWKTAAASAGR